MGCNKSRSKREVYSKTVIPQETRRTSNRLPNFTPKTTGERRRRRTTTTTTKKKKEKERNHKDLSRNK